MSDIERRRGSELTRKQREERAYKLVLATGAAGAVAVVTAILAAIDLIGTNIPVLAAILAVIFFVMLRRTLR
ncbi:MAG: hypothetical protein M3P40_01640 [Actinomycetota bacterium]|nr:hypothetical protein [Actinomycetota bacterium]